MKSLFPFLLIACGSSPSSTSSSTTPSAVAPPADPLAAQIEQGKGLYVARCAKCHGDAGQGSKDAPPVVGTEAFPRQPRPGAKRDVEFHTAADVFAWTSRNMPGDAPGALSSEQMLAIFAFDLTANGIALDAPLDATRAASIVLHP